TNPNTAWETVGRTCLTPDDLTNLGQITPELVTTAFKKLTWPPADLHIQPPGGETLVNLDTNFYTTLTKPQTRTVTLLGQQITIEATPDTYRFNFDEEGQYTDTTNPGHPYPKLDNTYAYQDAHITRHPWIDVVYTGRYRTGTTGPWTTIPDSHIVTGNPQPLRIIEGIPQLIAPPN
ncbi:MAG: hypothetical protein ACRCYU_00575, partial [Nocardioides sp.]